MRRATVVLLLAALVAAVGSGRAAAAELTVSAAASLADALREIVPAFEAANPGARVRLNLGGSGALLQQIAHGAPVDVYASADTATMADAVARGLVRPGAARDFASNTLVLVVPATSNRRPQALADLRQPAYARVAIGLPASVPAGRYAQQALDAAGLWPAVQAKAVVAHSVRQVLDYVARGEVDAGFVYATDARLMPDRVRVALPVATPTPLRYTLAPVAASREPALAGRFVAHLLAPPAQQVLARHGFGRP